MTPAELHAAKIDDNIRQQAVRGTPSAPDRAAARFAALARFDPRRPLDDNLVVLASYVQPDDVFVDIGGGAGAVALPIALRCREVVNVDPSPRMREQFEASAGKAGISNARFVQASWPDVDGIVGDVLLTRHVTYFVRDIVRFIQALQSAARRRVMISVLSVTPPEQGTRLHELVFGEPASPFPSFRELLPVLWDLGILPDVRVLPMPVRYTYLWRPQPSPEEMVAYALDLLQTLGAIDVERAGSLLSAHFDDLFAHEPEGYTARWPREARELLITWETRR